MKYAVFALLLGLFVTVAICSEYAVPINDVDSDETWNIAERSGPKIEPRSFFSGLKSVFKTVLKSMRGINCTIKGVINVKNTALQLINDINSCGVAVTKEIQNVIDSCTSVINTCNNIIHLNEDVCDNGDYDDATDGDKEPSSNCALQLFKELVKLVEEIENSIDLIKKVPSIPSNAGVCVNTSMTTALNGFNDFPNYVRQCAAFPSSG